MGRALRGGAGRLVLLAIFGALVPLSNPRVYAVDEVGYFVYLRSLRFDGDLNFENEYRALDARNPRSGIAAALLKPGPIKDGGRRSDITGLYGNVAPIGSALLWSPFYLLADALVQLANALGAAIPADGYSWPYVWAVCYAAALYGMLGLLLCHWLALRFVRPFAATLATAAVWLASPLVFYMVVQMPWSHTAGLFVVSCFLALWHATRGQRSVGQWLALGALGGLLFMVREQLVLFMLVPAIEALAEYWRLLRAQSAERKSAERRAAGLLFLRHCLFVLAFVVALLPQLGAYQILNGRPLPHSEVSGKFRDTWYAPCFFHTLVDPTPCLNSPGPAFSHGALLWSPVLALALLGLPLLWRRDRLLLVALAVALAAQLYVNGSIYTWHLSRSFGFRRLIECSPIFILGLALLVGRAQQVRWARPLAAKAGALVLAGALIAWNVGLAFNWTVAHPALRTGLVWPDLIGWQLDVPRQAASKVGQLLFDRCKLYQNQGCAER
ncbi:MAG: hypothetical protein H7Y32_20590 [Chloroflexales bacterium]|nr:hypothetical protein [Chloroflexales bacterium]